MEKNEISDQNEVISKKLEVADYVFEYNGIDLNNARLEYRIYKNQQDDFKNDEALKGDISPYIDFSISADDKNKETHSFDFMVNMDADMLKRITDKPANINEYIVQGELFFHNPYDESVEFMDFHLEENIYNYQPYFFISKLDNNKFAFKIQYQNLFIWFNADFD